MSFIQGPHCNRRSFMDNLVDDRHLNYCDRCFRIVFADLIKSILPEKSVENLNSSESILKHPFEMRIAVKKRFGKR